MLFVGLDWAEAEHEVCVLAGDGRELGRRRVSDGVAGVGQVHELLGEHRAEGGEVIIGVETDRGLFVGALLGAGYRVYAINPLAASRYRERHAVSGGKSDPGDAKVLADLVRTDRHNHRELAGNSEAVEGLQVVARAHQDAVWQRQRQVNRLRSTLREYYPAALAAFGTDLAKPETLAVLKVAPTPQQGRGLPERRIAAVLRKSGRERNVEARARQIREALGGAQLEPSLTLAAAYAAAVRALAGLIEEFNVQIGALEAELAARFEAHPDAEILRSLPGLGLVLGARVLAEFGDDRTRYAHAKARKAFAGTAPITRSSGKRLVVHARRRGNRRLSADCYFWAFASLQRSQGARGYYDALRERGKSNRQALMALANRWVGILHGCLKHRATYDENTAWPALKALAA